LGAQAPAAGLAAAAPQAVQPGFGSALNAAGNWLNDPHSQYWLNILGSGLAGKDIGTASSMAAQTQGAQIANQQAMMQQKLWAQMLQQYQQRHGLAQPGQAPAGLGAASQPPAPAGGGIQSGGMPTTAAAAQSPGAPGGAPGRMSVDDA